MDKRIHYGTKEENNARREREFLALTPHERFMWFLRSFDRPPGNAPRKTGNSSNFIVRKRHDALR